MKPAFYLKLSIISLTSHVLASLEFTNIKCIETDPTFHHFTYCYIKAVNRTYKYLSLQTVFHTDRPLNDIGIGFRLYKKANGYKPFLYNITVEACKYLNKPTNILFKYFHSYFERYSNMNHTCPYKNGVIVEKLPISHMDNMMTKVLPMPPGDYMVETDWLSDHILRANVKVYMTIRE